MGVRWGFDMNHSSSDNKSEKELLIAAVISNELEIDTGHQSKLIH